MNRGEEGKEKEKEKEKERESGGRRLLAGDAGRKPLLVLVCVFASGARLRSCRGRGAESFVG